MRQLGRRLQTHAHATSSTRLGQRVSGGRNSIRRAPEYPALLMCVCLHIVQDRVASAALAGNDTAARSCDGFSWGQLVGRIEALPVTPRHLQGAAEGRAERARGGRGRRQVARTARTDRALRHAEGELVKDLGQQQVVSGILGLRTELRQIEQDDLQSKVR